MFKIAVIGLGGFIGAIARYLLSGFAQRFLGDSFPWGTLAVNVFGCFAIGLLIAATDSRLAASPNLRLFIGIGLLGAFTTFSTFGYETLHLIGQRQIWAAILNVGANVAIGLLAVWLGQGLGKLLDR